MVPRLENPGMKEGTHAKPKKKAGSSHISGLFGSCVVLGKFQSL